MSSERPPRDQAWQIQPPLQKRAGVQINQALKDIKKGVGRET